MSLSPEFHISISKPAHFPEEESGNMFIVIKRPFSHLEKELRSAFKGQENVKVIVDRRYRERRKTRKAVKSEQRQAPRRRPKEEIVEVVISP